VTAPEPADPGPQRTARATIAQHSRSFALASRLLGRRVRDQTAVVYTWCRRVDDAIDEPGGVGPDGAGVLGEPRPASRAEHAAALARLTADVDAAYAATATEPVLAAFGDVVRARGIPRRYPDELLAGLAMDAAAERYDTVDDLIGYAWRLAGVVGLMMSHVFGLARDEALIHAAHLGIAMQLTNVCRDVAEDWRRGRLYLPDELLAAHGACGLAGDLGRPMPASAAGAIACTRAELLGLADRYYRSGDRGLIALPWRAALSVAAARRVYAAIGARIARTGYRVAAARAVVPLRAKLALVVAALAGLALTAPRRLGGRAVARVPTRVLELCDVPRL